MSFDRPYIRQAANLDIESSESGLVLGMDMVPNGATMPDLSGEGNDGTIESGVVFEYDEFSKSTLHPDKDVGIIVGSSSSLDITTEITISFWVKPISLSHASGSNPRILDKSGSYYVYVNSSGGVLFGTTGVSDPFSATANQIIKTNLWSLIVCTYNSVSGVRRIYVNGEIEAEETGLTGTISLSSNPLLIGNASVANRSWYGNIGCAKIFNTSKDESWTKQEYNRGLKALFKTDYGVNISTAPVTGGCLENTPFRVASGSFNLSNDTINGIPAKVIECNVNGHCYIPAGFLSGNQYQNSYGSWEFWLLKSSEGANEVQLQFVAETTGLRTNAGQNGYLLRFDSSERVLLERVTNGVPFSISNSVAGYVNINEWYKLRVDRNYDGSFSYYVNDVLVPADSGTNPIIDSTFNTTFYCVLTLRSGNKFAYADKNGGHSFIKRQLP